ncbi:MAG: hypothetical protein WCO92_06010, partial [Verrucomicrobiota bacterium]
ARNCILSTLFHEPSTRTRLSFETAMLRLGGHVISSDNPGMTSAAKGETIADSVRVIENYADIIVIRHPSEGAARVAADYSEIPVINGGDGGHEHPTQTLCDLYTLKKEKKDLKGLHVVLVGDLKHGRTIHSLVYALARFGAYISTQAAKGLELPDHAKRRLREEFSAVPTKLNSADVVYIADSQGESSQNQINEMRGWDVNFSKEFKQKLNMNIDILYMTRLQKERLSVNADTKEYTTVVNQAFLKPDKYKNTTVLHPLPRNEELGYDMDNDPRGAYFRQAAYGVAVRMALITFLLELKAPHQTQQMAPNNSYRDYISPIGGIRCTNTRCITEERSEQRYLRPEFYYLDYHTISDTLRCIYCEHEVAPACYGYISNKKFFQNMSSFKQLTDNIIFFDSTESALKAGYTKSTSKNIKTKSF